MDKLSDARDLSWTEIVSDIKSDNSVISEAGLTDLYMRIHRGLKYFLQRKTGSGNLDDKVHETFVVITNAIKTNDLRNPECLMGYIRTIIRNQAAYYVEKIISAKRFTSEIDELIAGNCKAAFKFAKDRRPDPEKQLLIDERRELVQKTLESLRPIDREVLVRYYLHEQTKEQICEELKIGSHAFDCLKNRAKDKFGKKGQHLLTVSPCLASRASA